MAHLLGSKTCLESLARDIEDIQNTINDCSERIDISNIQSWKFPDKLSHELEIDDLLKTYSYSNDPDFDRLAHIVLFELVIDRFVFLVQIVAQFLDKMWSAPERAQSSRKQKGSKLPGSTMSIGLAVKKFWNKAVHVVHNTTKLQQKARDKESLLPKMGDTIASLQEDNDIMRDALLSMHGRNSVLDERPLSSVTTRSSNFMMPTSASSLYRNGSFGTESIGDLTEVNVMSKAMSSTATQTFDTAFIACEACAHMQQNLIDVGTAMISLCESQGLQSSLARQKKLLKKSLMAATDIKRWTTEQNRDIERINKHLEYLYSEIEPLKSELQKSRETSRKLREQVKQLKSDKEGAEVEFLEKEKEFSQKIQVMSEEYEKNENALKGEVDELKTGKRNTEDRLALLEEENIERKKVNQQLENENAKITENLEGERCEKERLKEFEKEFHEIKQELMVVRDKLNESEIELGKAQTENKALTKHGKTIQAKQEMLLQRADQLDQECEELQNRILEMENERERLLNENESLKDKNQSTDKKLSDLQVIIDETAEEKRNLESEVKTLHEKVTQLETEISDATKQLTLLSEFPILGHMGGTDAAQYLEDELLQKSVFSLGDEMAKQVKANNIRIAVLEEQNNSLRTALARYEHRSENIPSQIPTDRVPLWDCGQFAQIDLDENAKTRRMQSHRTANESNDSNKHSEWFQTGQTISDAIASRAGQSQSPKPPSQPRTASSKLNEKRQAYSSTVPKSRGTSSWSDVPIFAKGQKATMKKIENENRKNVEDEFEKTDVFSCPDCDKMYSNKRDLQIHKSFCYANV